MYPGRRGTVTSIVIPVSTRLCFAEVPATEFEIAMPIVGATEIANPIVGRTGKTDVAGLLATERNAIDREDAVVRTTMDGGAVATANTKRIATSSTRTETGIARTDVSVDSADIWILFCCIEAGKSSSLVFIVC